MFKAIPNCLRLLRQTVRAPLSPDLASAGNINAARMARVTMTTCQFNQREGAVVFFRNRRGPVRWF